MNIQAKQLQQRALEAKVEYMVGKISYNEMESICSEYIDFCNVFGKDLAKKHGVKFKRMSVKSFMR